MEQDSGSAKPVEVVHEPLPDMEELSLADGELLPGGDVLVIQPQLHHEGDDDAAVDGIPEMKSIFKYSSIQVFKYSSIQVFKYSSIQVYV